MAGFRRISAVERERAAAVRRNRRSHGWGSDCAITGLVVRDSSGGVRHETRPHERLHEDFGFVGDGGRPPLMAQKTVIYCLLWGAIYSSIPSASGETSFTDLVSDHPKF